MLFIVIAALFVAFLWGLSAILNKIAFRSGITPATALFVGGIVYVGCMTVYLAINRKKIKQDLYLLDTKTVAFIGIATFVAVFLGNVIYFYLLKSHPAYIVTTLSFCSPLFTLALAYFFLQESVTLVGLFGVVLVVLGLICLGIQRVD